MKQQTPPGDPGSADIWSPNGTELFERAACRPRRVAKDDPAEVASDGLEALMAGKGPRRGRIDPQPHSPAWPKCLETVATALHAR